MATLAESTAPVRINNYLFTAMRVGLITFWIAGYIILGFMIPEPDRYHPQDLDPHVLRVVIPFIAVPWITYVMLTTAVWTELSDVVTIQRLWGKQRRPLAQLTRLSFGTSRGSCNFVPVAEFKSINFHFGKKMFYVRASMDAQQRIVQFLTNRGMGNALQA